MLALLNIENDAGYTIQARSKTLNDMRGSRTAIAALILCYICFRDALDCVVKFNSLYTMTF